MALGGTRLKVVLSGKIQGQMWQAPCWYETSGAAFLTATPVTVGEAWWNDIKAAWRGLYIATALFTFDTVFVTEPGASGQYGTYAVPSGERQGTRSSTADNEALPPFLAAAIRLTVGSRVTRPGQKRPPLLVEADSDNGSLSAATATLVDALAVKYSTVMSLGAPVATGTMTPLIARVDPVTYEILADQPVTGYLVNPYVMTQNSRKYGHGV